MLCSINKNIMLCLRGKDTSQSLVVEHRLSIREDLGLSLVCTYTYTSQVMEVEKLFSFGIMLSPLINEHNIFRGTLGLMEYAE